MARRVYICGIDTSTLPKITQEESMRLLKKIKAGDEQAKDYYVYCNMRLVLSVAQRFVSCKENMDDIFQVGCVGLLKAVDNFDISLNVQFSTYAVPMIIGEIKRFLRDSSAMRVSRSLRDTAYMVLKSKEKLQENRNEEVSLEDVAHDLNLTIREVYDAIDAISTPLSLDDSFFTDGDEEMRLDEHIADNEHSIDKWIDHTDLLDAIKNLDERERQILNLRYFIGKTQMEVSDSVGISQAQVSRLEKNALEHIKKSL
ncbi:MAG TPA: SigB/SigF/SigG family RNA polymerase sigma factor [Candidatus Onthoplasma faecigallinarum]|nr:SigB/SigF/SigG family RNA polymerase sigma factor [Candidatus Onthoplasma faecigallinarum]